MGSIPITRSISLWFAATGTLWPGKSTGGSTRSVKDKKAIIHNAREVAGIRRAAKAAAWVRDQFCHTVKPGMSTLELDHLAAELIRKTGGTSAFHGYRGFPAQVCISLNDEVVHGIGRADRIIGFGDLVSIDVGVRLDGFIGDTALTLVMPPGASDLASRLVRATRESLDAGIAVARGGRYISDIGRAVDQVIRRAGFTVVRDFVGHGVGCELHEPPEVPNFETDQRGPRLQAGMVLAIEPMVNTGTHRIVVDGDGWTVRTAGGGV